MPNRLAAEASPYLRQHAGNPVDWYPWGEAAFERARAKDLPILLSAGYAACHWCHVMAHESFEDAALAAAINAGFVAIKVDREEHPDVDALYQGICQAVTGQGGWPLTVFLTPDLEPFYAGTYFPPRSRYGRPGFGELLEGIARAWRADRARVLEVAAEWTGVLRRLQEAGAPARAPAAPPPGRDLLAAAGDALLRDIDPIHGGFGGAPKFPQTAALEVLLRCGGRPAERAAFTLRAMAAGGIRDHLAGGFHRYSVDEAWTVPHFEKMLYDNALLVPLYLAAYQRTGEADLAAVARETLDYLLRDMAAPEGAFYSTEDADSPDGAGRLEEGAFYTWTPGEVAAAAGDPDLARRACSHFCVTAAGSFEAGRSVLRLGAVEMEGAEEAPVRAAMLAARARRPRPGRDEKILAGWNGLAISALARAGRILDEPRYTRAAEAAARFVRERLSAPGGGLLRRHPAGPSALPGTLEDYSYLAVGLADLYEATLDPAWLGEAVRLARETLRRFWDPGPAVFYLSERDRAILALRPRDDGDGGTPAAQSYALQALVRLQPYVSDAEFAEVPAAVLARCAEMMARHPRGLASLLCVLDAVTDPLDVVLAAAEGEAVPAPWLEGLRARHLPNLRLSRVAPAVPGLDGLPPAWEGRARGGGAPALWVCRGQTCLPPAKDWAEVEPFLP